MVSVVKFADKVNKYRTLIPAVNLSSGSSTDPARFFLVRSIEKLLWRRVRIHSPKAIPEQQNDQGELPNCPLNYYCRVPNAVFTFAILQRNVKGPGWYGANTPIALTSAVESPVDLNSEVRTTNVLDWHSVNCNSKVKRASVCWSGQYKLWCNDRLYIVGTRLRP